jgi:hypothetical protein
VGGGGEVGRGWSEGGAGSQGQVQAPPAMADREEEGLWCDLCCSPLPCNMTAQRDQDTLLTVPSWVPLLAPGLQPHL